MVFQNLQTGKILKESDKEVGHKKGITSLQKSVDGSHFITGSLDKSAKVAPYSPWKYGQCFILSSCNSLAIYFHFLFLALHAQITLCFFLFIVPLSY